MDDHDDDMATETDAKRITRMAGRRPLKPTKLTVELIEVIVRCTLTGASHASVCRMIGVGERTYRYWRQWGRDGTHGDIYRQFTEAVRAAEAAVAFEMAQSWRMAAKSDWRACRAYLESRFSQEWGASRHTSPPSPPVIINVTLATGQQLTDVIPEHLGTEHLALAETEHLALGETIPSQAGLDILATGGRGAGTYAAAIKKTISRASHGGVPVEGLGSPRNR